MSKKFSELRFEEWIEQSLLRNGYTRAFIHSNEFSHLYDNQLCLIGEDLLTFIKNTQEEEYNRLFVQYGDETNDHILKTVDKTITQRGIINTLRNGIQTRGCSFHLVYFKPKSSMNLEHQDLYAQNCFTVVRQLHYSILNKNSIDMVLFLNGIPIITMELKNQLTGQDITNSENQYRFDREPKETLLSFRRCLVHFCVDNDKVSMTTRLNGQNTRFLPYNKGITNPNVEDDYRTEFLWNDILTPDSLLDIIENFVLVAKETDKVWDEKKKMVVEKTNILLIFPRYHQLELLRRLKSAIKDEGVGNNYLVQHTTGSGKSFSIGWLAHMLVSLYRYEADNQRMFDTIIVVTDRKVLDDQLQSTVSSLEQTQGVVNPVKLNSKQLMEFLEKGKDIIISTVQKFPHISEAISKLKTKTFAVIIDEVHSSQSGETSKHLKKSISKSIIQADDEEDEVLDYEEIIREEILSRGKQPHISFFGFTGTPKNKTLELFGRKNEEGKFVPFHTYSMKQSIHEGFTLDVLKNYTTYKRYFKVLQTSETDEELPEGRVKRELVNFVDSHAETISQKVSIILDHFIRKTSKTINGRGRGMVVVRSRKHCVLFHEEMVKQMKQRGLSYSCLVGFSGFIYHNGMENTEISLNSANGMVGKNIPNGLKDPRYRILIVSNKFQTGFDEPLLQTMYIDKKLGGVQCVQTLSRLNRVAKGKTETFVLDFVNDVDEVVESFQPYYTTTLLEKETDPDKLYDLVYEIEQYNLYTKEQLESFCIEFYSNSSTDQRLQYILNTVVKNYEEKLDDNQKDEFKSKIQSFIRLYAYISQISNFTEIHWEKTYVFLQLLNKKLPKGKRDKIDITDSVDLDSFRIQMISESKLKLEDKTGVLDPPTGDVGAAKGEEEKELLSEIINKINTLFGSELKEEDRITIERVKDKLRTDEETKKVLLGNNTEDVKKDFFKTKVKNNVIDEYGDRFDFYKMIMNEKIFPYFVDYMYKSIQEFHGRR